MSEFIASPPIWFLWFLGLCMFVGAMEIAWALMKGIWWLGNVVYRQVKAVCQS